MAYCKACVQKKLFVLMFLCKTLCKTYVLVHPIQHFRILLNQNCFTRYFGVNYCTRHQGTSSSIAFMACVLQKYFLGVLVWTIMDGRSNGIALQDLGAAEMHSGSPSGVCQISPLITAIHFTRTFLQGYAFVQFTSPFDARSACLGEDAKSLCGQTLDVNMVSEPKAHISKVKAQERKKR